MRLLRAAALIANAREPREEIREHSGRIRDDFRFLAFLLSLLGHLIPLKPIWTYSIQLWGTAFNSNIEIIQRFQNKYLGIIVNAP